MLCYLIKLQLYTQLKKATQKYIPLFERDDLALTKAYTNCLKETWTFIHKEHGCFTSPSAYLAYPPSNTKLFFCCCKNCLMWIWDRYCIETAYCCWFRQNAYSYGYLQENLQQATLGVYVLSLKDFDPCCCNQAHKHAPQKAIFAKSYNLPRSLMCLLKVGNVTTSQTHER